MYEVELKVRADHGPVRRRLAAVGAERVGAVTQTDSYYDAPHREFAATDEALRLRRERREGEATTTLTYKGPLVDEETKTRVEHETDVDDPDATEEMLAALGFEPAATVEKRRERYRLGDYAVTLDDVDGLGEFVEVERRADDTDLDAAREGAFDLLERLGLDDAGTIRTSYLGMLLDAQE
jgi:adenylate cyclase class 2